MTAEKILALKELWREAFGDTDAFIDAFFNVGFSPDRCHIIEEKGQPVSVLYWFDCQLSSHRLAYIYGVATRKSHRGRGLARQLLTETHSLLKDQGYSCAVLVPGGEELFSFYRTLGYKNATTVTVFSCQAADGAVALREISPSEYARLRQAMLPAGGVVQADQALAFYQSYGRFYAGEDFLLAAAADKDTLFAQELLGNTDAAPGILQALGHTKGSFRAPGAGREFAMYFPMTPNCPRPSYFGLALD